MGSALSLETKIFRMKILKYSLVCFMIGTLSCSTKDSNNRELRDIPNLTGAWLISSSFGAMCNVCPELVFVDSKSGNIVEPSKQKYDFEYDLQKDKISFHFEGQAYFDLNSEFNYTLKSDGILRYLTLVPLDDNGEIIIVGEK